jgi:mRNA interferase RelE/StbE
MQVEFKESFAKDLSKIDIATLNKIKRVIEQVELADSLSSIAHIKKLKGSEQRYYRIRIGDYRIGLKLEIDKLILIRFLHRKEMYRYFP